MDIKKIRIQRCNLNDIKIDILKSLNLFDYKKNCLVEFEQRIESYTKRHNNLKIIVEIKNDKLSKEIYDKNFSKLDRYRRKIPENYPFGASNMETQAYYDPIICDEQYYIDVENVKRESEKELEELKKNLKIISIESRFEFEII